MTGVDPAVEATIGRYRAVGVEAAAADFARMIVGLARPAGPARARSLLWVCSRLGQWGACVGLDASAEVLLHPSVIERFVTVGMADRSATARRTARTNLRFVAVRVGVAQLPGPTSLPRCRAKAPYSPVEVACYFGWADAQPTEARRHRLCALLCLGLGAGLEGPDLRALRGRHVVARSAGVVVEAQGRRARVVPVLVRYQAPLLAAADFAGDGLLCAGISPTRKNVTANFVARLAGGADLPRLEVGRLRSTWLAEQLARLGVDALLSAAGLRCSQRLGDLARHLPALDEANLVARLS